MLGLFWSFFNPLILLTVYTFVFSEIFKARWSGGGDSKTEFALLLFAGLIVFNLFSECVNRAPTLIISNPNYVKKIIFPLEIMSIISLLSAMYHAMVSIAVWLVAYSFLTGIPHITALYLPLYIIPLCIFITGISWILSSLGVYFRDVSQFIGSLTTILMFLSPIFYPASTLPERYRSFLYINPLTPVIEGVRDVLFWGKSPNFNMIVTLWIGSLLMAWMGFSWFQKTRKGFADVL